jgi:large subunit ribosomal protein L2
MVEIYEKLMISKLTIGRVQSGGRGMTGVKIMSGRGGRVKMRYRFVDFKGSLMGMEGKIVKYNYDPLRNSGLLGVMYSNGMVSEILRPEGISVGSRVGREGLGYKSKLRIGDRVFCTSMRKGMFFHNLEMSEGCGGKLLRAGGSYGQVIRVVRDRVLVKLRSGRIILTTKGCFSSIGKVMFRGMELVGKAGRNRWLGRSSKVRGVAMNPVDHPHGGATSGGRCSVSSTGLFTKCGGNRKKIKREELNRYYG